MAKRTEEEKRTEDITAEQKKRKGKKKRTAENKSEQNKERKEEKKGREKRSCCGYMGLASGGSWVSGLSCPEKSLLPFLSYSRVWLAARWTLFFCLK